jgi:hypothetical protein
MESNDGLFQNKNPIIISTKIKRNTIDPFAVVTEHFKNSAQQKNFKPAHIENNRREETIFFNDESNQLEPSETAHRMEFMGSAFLGEKLSIQLGNQKPFFINRHIPTMGYTTGLTRAQSLELLSSSRIPSMTRMPATRKLYELGIYFLFFYFCL